MKREVGRLVVAARDQLRSRARRLRARLEDRLMGVILDATRVTNDGSYRRYRDEPAERGERLPEAAGRTGEAGADMAGATAADEPAEAGGGAERAPGHWPPTGAS
jgi:hypothetical protein